MSLTDKMNLRTIALKNGVPERERGLTDLCLNTHHHIRRIGTDRKHRRLQRRSRLLIQPQRQCTVSACRGYTLNVIGR